jgi:pSer/pThr/pTyr-binding forkhead associated (FHA) protein
VLIDTNTHVVYRLDKSVMTMGNSENDDIFVAGFLIGDGHLVIEKKGPIMWIIGKRFTRKFKVNGHKTKNHMLEHKDRIEIGKSTFRYMESA